MKIAGIVLVIIGAIASIGFGIQVANQSETTSFLGVDIAVSQANWTPLIISIVVLVVGLIMVALSRRKTS